MSHRPVSGRDSILPKQSIDPINIYYICYIIIYAQAWRGRSRHSMPLLGRGGKQVLVQGRG